MAERRLWVKLWATWYTTPSHIGVGAMALHVGETLMTLVLWEPGRDDAWAEFETGLPLPIDAIADRAQLSPKAAERALLILEQRGTVSRRPDGAWGFKLYGPSQESADAARKRRTRKPSGKGPDMSGGCPADVLRIVEVEAEAEADLTPPTPSPGVSSAPPLEAEVLSRPPAAKPKAKPRKPRTDLPDGLAAHVLAELVQACRELDGPSAGPRHSADHEPYLDALRKLHAAHAPTPDEWTAVIRERLALSREGQTFGSLTVASLCAPANFERWLASARARTRGGSGKPNRGAAPPSPRPTVAGIVDVSTGRVTPVDLGSVSDFLLDFERGDT